MTRRLPAHALSSETLAETLMSRRGTSAAPALSRAIRKLMTGLTAAAVALSLLAVAAVPARADKRGDDLAKALAAALILGAIVNGIDNKGSHHPKPQPPQPKPNPVKHPRVPSVCAIEIDSQQQRNVTVYSENCMREEGFNYRLPDCARNIRIYGERDRVYSAQCLRDAGFTVGGR